MKTLRFALLGTALLAASSLALPVLAQPAAPPTATPAPPPPGPMMGRSPHMSPGAIFRMIDADNSGRVTWEESWAFVQARFAEADRNRDGSLVMEELLAARLMPPPAERPAGAPPAGAPEHGPPVERARMMGMMFRAIDANRDAKVTLDEIRPMVEARFRALDANGDNGITLDELPAPPRHGRHGQHGHGQHGPMHGPGPGASPPR